MSSHHTIRENQEPAVFLLETEAIDSEMLRDVLEWSPLLICSEPCLAWILEQGLKIDAVIAKKEQKDEIFHLLSHQLPVRYIVQEDSSLQNGLAYIASTQNPSCYLFADWNAYLPFAEEVFLSTTNITWLRGQQQAFLLKNRAYSKWYAIGTTVEIIPVSTACEITINEEKKILKERFFLKIEKDQFVQFDLKGICFLVEPLT